MRRAIAIRAFFNVVRLKNALGMSGDEGAPLLVKAGPETHAIGRGDRPVGPGDEAQTAEASLPRPPADPLSDDEASGQAIMIAVKARIHCEEKGTTNCGRRQGKLRVFTGQT